MAISLKHKFVNTKVDGTDATKVRPSNWNDDHNLTMSSSYIIGRLSAGDGVAEELTLAGAGGLTVTSDAANKRLILNPNVTGQQTIWVPAAAMYARTSSGAGSGTVETTTNRVMLRTLDFDTSLQEFAQFAIQMPKSWNEGALVCQFVWSHGAATTPFGVVWQIQAAAFADLDGLDALAFGAAVSATDTGGTTNALYISPETASMTVAGSPTPEEWVVFQVARAPADASDTMTVDARLHGVKIKYTTDSAVDN